MAVLVDDADKLPLGKSSHQILPIGIQIGKLSIHSKPFKRRDVRGIFYECECECGDKTVIRSKSIGPYGTLSCGCHRLKTMSNNGKSSKGRKLRKNDRICKHCNLSEKETEFREHGLICKSCRRKKRSTPEYLAKRRIRDRELVESSPEKFLQMLLKTIRTQSENLYHKNRRFDLDLKYLTNLWKKQKGLCTLSKLPMIYKRHSIYKVSVDRIDSAKGYIKGNVQLVCKCMNLAKQNHSNTEILEMLDKIRAQAP